MRDSTICAAAERRGTEEEARNFFDNKLQHCPVCVGMLKPDEAYAPAGRAFEVGRHCPSAPLLSARVTLRCKGCGTAFCCDEVGKTLCVLRAEGQAKAAA